MGSTFSSPTPLQRLVSQYLARAADVSICTVTETCVLYTTKKDESV